MELGGPWAFMIGDGLSVFAIIEVSDNTGRRKRAAGG
jgi:hypothetical protein